MHAGSRIRGLGGQRFVTLLSAALEPWLLTNFVYPATISGHDVPAQRLKRFRAKMVSVMQEGWDRRQTEPTA